MTASQKPAFSHELRVGLLVAGTVILAGVFAWMVGVGNPFSSTETFYVTYHFAGGIEVGSPVRVSGIKVGRVDQIDLFVPSEGDAKSPIALQEPGSVTDGADGKAVVPVRLKLSVRRDIMRGIRKDSRFYINLAGIIGERYVEVTPGTLGSPEVKHAETLAGIDPPRIDQLISQSFDLAGKIEEIIQENKGDLTKSIELLYKLSGNLNKTLAWVDKSAVFKTDLGKLIENLISITADVRRVTDKTHTPEGEKTLKLLYDLLWRLEPMDSKNIREFLQKEGIRAHIF